MFNRPWFPFVAVLAVVSSVDIGKDIVVLTAQGIPVRLGILGEQFLWWTVWGALIPAVLWLAIRTAPSRIGWTASVASQVMAGLLFVPLHIGLSAAAFTLLPERLSPGGFQNRFWGMMDSYFVASFGIYAASIVTFLVWSYQLQLRVRERAASEAELRAARLEVTAKEARMEALRRELDPHFLHNALQSVSGLVRGGENSQAIRMIAALGSHLRVLLDRDASPMISLATEVELLGHYVEVERVRFEHRMRVSYALDPGTEGARVPPMILQPLVENAIRHGVARTRSTVSIEVSARIETRGLVITVCDDGPGILAPSTRRMGGLGLANVRDRLGHAFGSGAVLTLEPREAGGTRVEMVIPIAGIEFDAASASASASAPAPAWVPAGAESALLPRASSLGGPA